MLYIMDGNAKQHEQFGNDMYPFAGIADRTTPMSVMPVRPTQPSGEKIREEEFQAHR
jgi:hypothetical protein